MNSNKAKLIAYDLIYYETINRDVKKDIINLYKKFERMEKALFKLSSISNSTWLREVRAVARKALKED